VGDGGHKVDGNIAGSCTEGDLRTGQHIYTCESRIFKKNWNDTFWRD